MFRYCVWYKIRKKHPINTLIEKNASLLNTATFPAHVTIKHSIVNKQEAVDMAKRFQNHTPPLLQLFSQPFLSHVIVDNTNFYSVEQMLLVNNKKVDGVHVSLAYSNKNLTSMELACCMPQDSIKFSPDDLEVVVYECHDQNPSKWSMVWNAESMKLNTNSS